MKQRPFMQIDVFTGAPYFGQPAGRAAGQVYLERDPAGQVWVGGESVICIDGNVTL